ncbi:hypothetical protein SADUNF_Sadunf18G0046900 [Salix dunnii]|uniref:Uncharacterized protein n=1 Tax=Salix dunnii TaxID=1413687 RepID=A0A835MDF8_9ROSI|nr:hypothetical protein SADUNF_Sadunf18G0046900 [Salix dunnii]
MEILDLGFSYFHRTIPESLFYSKSLKYLDLGNNYLSGDLHEFFQPLVFLNLSSNLLSAMNSIVGGIPTCNASLEELTHLNLSFNHLNFATSPILVFSKKLLALLLSLMLCLVHLQPRLQRQQRNEALFFLTRPIVFSLVSTGIVSFSQSSYCGNPASIGSFTYLQVIDLSSNSLSGSIPLNIVGCFQLRALVLNNNNVSGQIQPELDALDSLKVLAISNNRISNEIPLTLPGCKSLEIVDFSSNNLSGNLNYVIT